MPIWIKFIVMLWVITFVGAIFVRIWASETRNVHRIIKQEYPIWALAVAVCFLVSILSVIPVVAWFIFFR